jgi:uncharacterized protein
LVAICSIHKVSQASVNFNGNTKQGATAFSLYFREKNKMNYYLLTYYVVSDYIERRARHREEHLRLANEAHARGELILGGALTDPADRAVLVFRCQDKTVVEQFVQNDPYVRNGIVLQSEIRAWNVVIQ